MRKLIARCGIRVMAWLGIEYDEVDPPFFPPAGSKAHATPFGAVVLWPHVADEVEAGALFGLEWSLTSRLRATMPAPRGVQ